jgi:hypothetical protein
MLLRYMNKSDSYFGRNLEEFGFRVPYFVYDCVSETVPKLLQGYETCLIISLFNDAV